MAGLFVGNHVLCTVTPTVRSEALLNWTALHKTLPYLAGLPSSNFSALNNPHYSIHYRPKLALHQLLHFSLHIPVKHQIMEESLLFLLLSLPPKPPIYSNTTSSQ